MLAVDSKSEGGSAKTGLGMNLTIADRPSGTHSKRKEVNDMEAEGSGS